MGRYEVFLGTMLLSGGWMIVICLLQPKENIILKGNFQKRKIFLEFYWQFYSRSAR